MVDSTTAPEAGSIDAVAELMVETPEAPKNQRKADEAEVKASDDDQVEAEVEEEEDVDDVEADDDDTDDGDADEDDDEDSDGDEEPAKDVYTVKVDGKEVEVTLDDLKRSFSGQAYIQKGMEEAAQARKEVEAQKAEVEQVYNMLNQERQQMAQALQQFQQQGVPQPPKKPSKDLLDADPIAYFEQMEAYREGSEQYAQFQQYTQQMTERQSQAQAAAQQAYLQQQAQELTKAIPDFADPERATKLKQELVRVGVDEYGFSPEELTSIMDARHVRVLKDAMEYRKLKAGKTQAVAKAEGARPVVKPGSAKTGNESKVSKRQKAAARMKKSGDVDAVANFLLT